MKITELIKIFEQLLPVYKKGLVIYNQNFNLGLCSAYLKEFNSLALYDSDIFDDNGYYKNYMKHYKNNWYENLFEEGEIKPRIDFMKQQIIELNNLLKQGYTHI